MTSRRIAARYAEALFGIAGERGAVDALRVELGELVKVVQSSPELTGLLERPDIGAERPVEYPNGSRWAFIHPKDMFGVLFALIENPV